MNRYFFTLLFWCLCVAAWAQPIQKGGGDIPKIAKIKGMVIDAQTGQVVEFATVSVFSVADSTLVGGGITNEKGEFTVVNLPFGKHRAKIDFIGYQSIIRDSIVLTSQQQELNLGKIRLAQASMNIEEVTVEAEKELMQNTIDKRVFNVEKNITAIGGAAIDVLRNIPSISVDIDGNVNLRGSGNVTVLINGVPSGLSGSDPQAIFSQIPASAIENIEVITNPSAKYDPDGTAGIINIILKKNQKQGLNGNVSVNVGTNDKYNTSINLNKRSGKFNISGSYNFRRDRRENKAVTYRTNFLSDSAYYSDQNSTADNVGTSHLGRLVLDFFPNDKNTLSLQTTLSTNGSDATTDTYTKVFKKNGSIYTHTYRDEVEDSPRDAIDLNFSWNKRFAKPKKTLSFLATLSSGKGDDIETFQSFDKLYTALYFPKQRYSEIGKDNIFVSQLDWVNPTPKGKIEVGAKTIMRSFDTDFIAETLNENQNTWEKDALLSNRFIFSEKMFSLYGIWGHSTEKWNYQVGLRGEHTLSLSEQKTQDKNYEYNYTNIFPSAHFARNINKQNTLKIAYSKRINRPVSMQLNPFIDYSDPLNRRLGNPKLKPELIHSLELSHELDKEKYSVTSTLFYRYTDRAIRRFLTIDSTSILYVTFINLSSAVSFGVEEIFTADPTKWWNLTLNLSYFRNMTRGESSDGQQNLNNASYSWSSRLVSSMKLGKGYDFQLSGNYASPFVAPQGTIQAMYSMDIALKKDLWKGKGNINLRLSDVFNTMTFRFKSDNATTFFQNIERKRETRILFIGFAYNFGKVGDKQASKRREDSPIPSGGDGGF